MFDRAKFWRYARYTVLTIALLAAGFTLYLDFRVRSEFEGRRFALPRVNPRRQGEAPALELAVSRFPRAQRVRGPALRPAGADLRAAAGVARGAAHRADRR